MVITKITTKEEYSETLKRLEIIFDAKKGSADGEELDRLGALIDKYEKKIFPEFAVPKE